MILFAIVAAGAIFTGAKPTRGRPFPLFLAALVMIIMIGFRREVGGDWWAYLLIFDYTRLMDFAQVVGRSDPGYGVLNWVAGRAGWGVWFPNLICAILFTWGLIMFSRQQPNVWLALTVAVPYFLIGVAMGLTRQSAAVGLGMLALAAYPRGQTLRMIIYIGLATLFHFSAIVLAPLLAAASVKRGVVTVAVMAVLILLVYYQYAERFTSRFQLYTEHEFFAAGDVPRLLLNLIPALIFLSFRHRFVTSHGELRLWTVMSLVACLSMVLIFVVDATVIVDRLGHYLIPLQIFVLSRIPYVFGTRAHANMFLLSVIVAYSLLLEVGWLNLGRFGYAWLPYRNYLWDEGSGEAPPEWFRRRR